MGSQVRYAGIDIGSRTIELVVVDKTGNIVESLQADTGFNPMAEAHRLMEGVAHDAVMATGYGRNLFEISFEAPTVTEIKAHARGANRLFPEARTVLDIGGQDSKAMTLFPDGRVRKFEMNDRCAAGTGKFLEIMARTLGFEIEEFGREALLAENNLNISSMCTVFAESEVTSLIARGRNRREIARGLHASVVRRAVGMINRVSSSGNIVFTGGVAKNPCMRSLLAESLGRSVLIPEDPQLVGALGAALLAGGL
ncbi:acyl-CoA dehydratase activase [Desulfococcus multivorans]|uniref:CoA-substrate-specific enzyme activase n=1 Tax=Desulfococcus multivorans DSM 2059 TaxID=1121405 RepID=S7UZE4_DESML|nr:acyl-CoA dehydratase activase [Desulfococcus multivorans]AOY58290.1 HgdC: activator of 2-hydroxyglutaryl-CoA dehydratase, subunit alpha [Desulfococcus multivorans]AQV02929.2 3-hydroxyacyl-ACP dehydratase [Desulfococcus multivorans]EPR37768.1 CoA-substrate-specific enzyme activase [Desulfococcus multivorans DSM 2059]SJZ98216.1 CoA-substrate-specific enzyme activase, putative [Desulfococcus multivorans DSM 2059]